MKLLLSYSLLLASLCARSSLSVSSGSRVVTQSPDVSVMEGETVTITCCWAGQFDRGRVMWLKNQTNIETIVKNQSQGSLPKETSDCSHLNFTNIAREDSGRYTCELIVEMPAYAVLKGNGTVITVMTRDNTKDNTDGSTDAPPDPPISDGVSSGSRVVTQSPDVSVMEGETVTITCCWTGQFDRGRVIWLKNQTNIETILKNQSQGSLPKETLNCSHLTFTNIAREESGRYTCKLIVEIPFYEVLEGNGTVITVMTRDNTEDNTDGSTDDNTDLHISGSFDLEDLLLHALRLLPVLALVISFFYLNKLASKNQQRSAAATENTLPSAQTVEEGQEEEERETEGE